LGLARGIQKLAGVVLGEHGERVVDLEGVKLDNSVNIFSLLGHDAARLRLEPEAGATGVAKVAFDDDGIAVKVLFVSILALVLDLDCQDGAVAALFDEALEAASSVGRACLATEAERDGREDGTLAAAVLADYEIEEGAEVAVETLVAHEVDAGDALNDAIVGNLLKFPDLAGSDSRRQSLGGSCVVLLFVFEMLKVSVSQLVELGFGRGGRGCVAGTAAVRRACGIVFGGGAILVGRVAVLLADIRDAGPFALCRVSLAAQEERRCRGNEAYIGGVVAGTRVCVVDVVVIVVTFAVGLGGVGSWPLSGGPVVESSRHCE
jgi:hypothetical protein